MRPRGRGGQCGAEARFLRQNFSGETFNVPAVTEAAYGLADLHEHGRGHGLLADRAGALGAREEDGVGNLARLEHAHGAFLQGEGPIYGDAMHGEVGLGGLLQAASENKGVIGALRRAHAAADGGAGFSDDAQHLEAAPVIHALLQLGHDARGKLLPHAHRHGERERPFGVGFDHMNQHRAASLRQPRALSGEGELLDGRRREIAFGPCVELLEGVCVPH